MPPLAGPRGAAAALQQLVDELAPGIVAPVPDIARPEVPTGALDAASLAATVAALLPEDAVIVDEIHFAGDDENAKGPSLRKTLAGQLKTVEHHPAANDMPPSNNISYLKNLAQYAKQNVERWEKKKDAGESDAALQYKRAVEILGAVLQQCQPSWPFSPRPHA